MKGNKEENMKDKDDEKETINLEPDEFSNESDTDLENNTEHINDTENTFNGHIENNTVSNSTGNMTAESSNGVVNEGNMLNNDIYNNKGQNDEKQTTNDYEINEHGEAADN